MSKLDLSILIGGEAGHGSRKAGFIIGELFSEEGYRVFIYDDYQSLVRGGHNFSKLRVSHKKVLSHREKVDFLLPLDKKTISEHKKELADKGLIIGDKEELSELGNREGVLRLELRKIVKEAGGMPMMKNVALVSSFAKVIGIKFKTVEKVLRREIKKFQSINLKIAKIAFDEAENLFHIEKINRKPQPLLTGNQTTALGAVKAGLGVYIAYPMTPATGILHYLAHRKKEFKIKVVQLENEIGVINAAVGAVSGGARTMVGTSGGGFALMTEGLSLAAQAEAPVLIVESQRMAPATGVPTYTSQGDLLFVLGAGHGDFLRFVAAPGDAEESAILAGNLLNLSWKYQTPSILLLDKEISESTFSFDEEILKKIKPQKALIWQKKGEYKRYKITKDGISPLAFYGDRNAVVKVTSYEHDDFGITVEDEDRVKIMQDKRLRKFENMRREVEKIQAVKVYGKKRSKTGVVCWGSSKGPVLEAIEELGIKMIQPLFLEPFPEKQIKKALKGVERLILVETNALGQLEKILNRFGIRVNQRILKYTGRPFLPEEIKKRIKIKL